MSNFINKMKKDNVLKDIHDARIETIDSSVVESSVNPVEGGAVFTALAGKQDTLTAGSNIDISNGVISATDTTYTAGTNIDITNGVISVVGELGVDDYNDLDNKPIINQDLEAVGFTPVANTYYKHIGTTGKTYVSGKIYFYDGEEYKAIDGSGTPGGGVAVIETIGVISGETLEPIGELSITTEEFEEAVNTEISFIKVNIKVGEEGGQDVIEPLYAPKITKMSMPGYDMVMFSTVIFMGEGVQKLLSIQIGKEGEGEPGVSISAQDIGGGGTVGVLTSAPDHDNDNGRIDFVLLDTDPQSKYNGFIYIIDTGSEPTDINNNTIILGGEEDINGNTMTLGQDADISGNTIAF